MGRVKGWVHFTALTPVGCMAFDKPLTLFEPHLPSLGWLTKILHLNIMDVNVFCQLPMFCPWVGSRVTQSHLWEQKAPGLME